MEITTSLKSAWRHREVCEESECLLCSDFSSECGKSLTRSLPDDYMVSTSQEWAGVLDFASQIFLAECPEDLLMSQKEFQRSLAEVEPMSASDHGKPISGHSRRVTKTLPDERWDRLDQLDKGDTLSVVGTVQKSEFRTSSNGNLYLRIQIRGKDGSTCWALAFNGPYGNYRTDCAGSMEPGRTVRVRLKVAGNDTGFVNGVETKG